MEDPKSLCSITWTGEYSLSVQQFRFKEPFLLFVIIHTVKEMKPSLTLGWLCSLIPPPHQFLCPGFGFGVPLQVALGAVPGADTKAWARSHGAAAAPLEAAGRRWRRLHPAPAQRSSLTGGIFPPPLLPGA